MSGTPWETFGCAEPPGSRETSNPVPTSRSLNNEGGRYDWPPEELCRGVAGIEIRTHGDSPGGAFIRVCGDDQAAVDAAYERTAHLVRLGVLTPLFGGGEQ